MNTTITEQEPTVARLAIEHPGALAVFTKYNIDYCCGGHRSLTEACKRIGLDAEKIRTEIFQTAASTPSESFHPERWSAAFLADFILENHHTYVKRAIPELEPLLDKVCDRHGNDSPELVQIRECFSQLSEELISHMEKEELVLFPAIKRLEKQYGEGNPMEKMIQVPIEVMEHEHQAAGDLVKTIRALSNNYTAPDFACPTFLITYQKLKEFDQDLMRHIHLENNILFERYKQAAG